MKEETQNLEELSEDEKELFEDIASDEGNELSDFGEARRYFLKLMAVTTGGMLAFPMQ